MQTRGRELKCINLIEVIHEGKTEYKDEEGHSYPDFGSFKWGSTQLVTQKDQQEIKQKRKSNKISFKEKIGKKKQRKRDEEYFEKKKGEIIEEEQKRNAHTKARDDQTGGCPEIIIWWIA